MGKEELRQALALAAGCNSEDVQIGEIGVSKGGLGSAWVKCPAAGARKLAQAGKVVLGWSIARVSAIPKRPLQCFKCLELGRTGGQHLNPPPPPPPAATSALGSIDEEADELHGYMSAACDASMPRSVSGGRSDRCVYWWTPEIADMRASCVQARRRFLRARCRRRTRDEEEISRCYEDYRETRRALQREIKLAKARCWDRLIESVDSDPWGRPYRIVTKKLRPSPPPAGRKHGSGVTG